MTPNSSLVAALGISEKRARLFEKCSVHTLADLWFSLPLRYEDRSRLTPIKAFQHGNSVQFIATVQNARLVERRVRMLLVELIDENGMRCDLRFFNPRPGIVYHYPRGRRGLFYGRVLWNGFHYEIAHPDVTWLEGQEMPLLSQTLSGIYATTNGLTQSDWRAVIHQALNFAEELLPRRDALVDAGFMALPQALRTLHEPKVSDQPPEPLHPYFPPLRRLIVDELCAYRLLVQQMRRERQSHRAPSFPETSPLLADFQKQLPFTPTAAQARVVEEIGRDMARTLPMMRLVQGDVGCGKTLVALWACLQAVASGYQALMMVPTELLALQHLRSFRQLLGKLPVRCVVLVSALGAAPRRAVLEEMKCGRAQIIIGTQCLFQSEVKYHRVGLVVVDEQHRFGVNQRLLLQEKSGGVHQLVMSATPIPRTVLMCRYGELDVSVIDEKPQGRAEIQTLVVRENRRDELIIRVGAVCRSGKQAYWVCPWIEESEKLSGQSVEKLAQMLTEQLPDIRIGVIHARIKSEMRTKVMNDFLQGRIQLLVATTVIEVGVDVPNATLMIIENAERFGLAQLHQLRGRIGRGEAASYCVLVYQEPLSEWAKQRLQVMRQSQDGFLIAEKDLQLRGGGELLGARQSGPEVLRIADIDRDRALLESCDAWATSWSNRNDPIVEELKMRWLYESHYMNV